MFANLPSCRLFELNCTCRLLPFVAGILLATDCNTPDGIHGEIVEDLMALDVFLNREQKTKRAPNLFILVNDMTSDAIHLEALGRRMLHSWNVLLTREIASCADNIGAARTVFTVGPLEEWCVDAAGPMTRVVADFKAHASPRARVRAFAISKRNHPSAPRTFRATRIIIASVSAWAISAMVLFNRFAQP